MRRYIERLASLEWSKVVLISIVFAALYYISLYDTGALLDAKVQAAEKQVSDTKEKLVRTKAADKNVKLFVQKVESAEQQFKEVIEYMPPEINLGNFLQRVKDQASAAGASVQAFSPSNEVEKRDFYEIRKFDLQLNGNFSQLALFLSNLSKMPLLITFERISITSLGGEFDSPKLNFKGVLLGYRYMKDGAAAATPAATTPAGVK